jgi:hypothetical protein
MSGNPISFTIRTASSRLVIGVSVPHSMGAPMRYASARAAVSSPIMSSGSDRGEARGFRGRASVQAVQRETNEVGVPCCDGTARD